MKELIGRVRNKCWIAVLVLVFGFLCCGNMKVYAASCNNHVSGDIEFVWNENHGEANVYYICANCRQRYEYAGEAETWLVSYYEPTCTSKGTTRIYALFEDWTRDLETGGYLIDNTYIDVDNIEINPTAHTGEIILKDKKASNCTEDGYTGDRVYSCCEAVVESGTVL